MKQKSRSLVKILAGVLACLCGLSFLTSSTFGAAAPEFTDYETTEVSIPFSFRSYTDQTGFVYNDSMLLGSSQTFSPELAKISVVLATAAYNWENLSAALDQMGYEYPGYTGGTGGDPETPESKGNWGRVHEVDNNDFVRYVIASKDVGDMRLYCVVVQGTTGGYDWLSNFNIGEGDDHAGFYLAHAEIMAELEALMAQDGHSPDTRVVLTTGHSRGAAVSNIVAGELTDGVSQYVSPSHVFGYHFACPKVSRRSAVKNSGYSNIYVFNNKDDLVPEVPLADWGYGTYGVQANLADGCLDCVSSRIRAFMGKDYTGMEETVNYLTGILAADFPTASGANKIVQFVLKGLAFILKEETHDLQELLGRIGVSTSSHAVEMLLKIKDLSLSKVTQFFEQVRYASGLLGQYLSDTEGMTDEEFQAWFEEHRQELEQIEDAYDFNITGRESMQQMYLLLLSDTLSCGAGLGIDASDLLKITTTVTVIWVYLMTADGLEGARSAISDAHMGPTYLYWINAMYYGYRGWYCYSGSVSPVYRLDQSAVQTIGKECFANSPALVSLSAPDTVRYLGSRACMNASGLLQVSLPGSVACIGEDAFYGCTGLLNVSLSEGLKDIGDSAFCGCSSLTTVTIPKGGVKVWPHAFDYCTGLETVYAPDSTVFNPARFEEGSTGGDTTIFARASAKLVVTKDTGRILDSYLKHTYSIPSYLDGLSRIEVEEGITEIGEYAFYYGGRNDCWISDVVLPSSLRKIGAYAFYCNSISSITMAEGEPENPPEIGACAFRGCKKLTSVTLPEGLAVLEPSTFDNCSGLEQVTLPDSLTGIGASAFAWCNGLTAVTIPGNVAEIGTDAFFGCTGLTSVTISDGVAAIGKYAFCGCDNLKAVTIPASVETFGYRALGYNTSGNHISGFTIYGHGGTAAETYATGNWIPFVDLDTAVCPYGHTWNEGEVTTPAGCVEEGVLTCTCTICGETKTEPIPALGHDFVCGVCTRCGLADADGQVFADVQPGAYSFDAVRWALEQGVTDGTSETTFSPNRRCTRAEIVTMLWRAMGRPGHTGENPFTDVPEDAWYSDAVLWAVENHITDGVSPTTFSPSTGCTRAQIVTFIWRAAGCPEPTRTENPFTDVPEGAWYYNAVLWAVENGITTGTSAVKFSPGRSCTRAQAVTFLYRFLGE